ncbi:hypothetical protein R1flu_014177 [Riccia fluitans]|uniref:Uncharacterized protein n=1 Tax=Riccia fluitans TaxID=41844 RepID=A0ABD1YFD0_9MARC
MSRDSSKLRFHSQNKMQNSVVAKLVAKRKQKQKDTLSLKEIQEDIKRIMRATGSRNPQFQEASRGIKFTQGFKPQDWGKKKKRVEAILTETAFFNFWVLMSKPEIATFFMEALLSRINEMDIEEEMSPQERSKLLHTVRREWDYGKEYEVKDAEPWCPGHPLVKRTFKFFTKIPAEYYIHTSMRATVLNTIIMLMLFHPVNFANPQIAAALISFGPDPFLERMDQLAWKGVAIKLKCKSNVSDDDLPCTLAGTGWIYLWLQNEVLNGNGQAVIAGICGALELIARERGEVLTPAKELQIMCLLTTVSGIVSLVHLSPENQEKAEFFAAEYAQWFSPIREIAQNTAQVLWLEGKAPGSALRKRCASSDARFGLTQPTRVTHSSIHVVVSSKSHSSYNLTYLLNATPIEADVEPYNDVDYVHYTRWRMILQMLRCCGVEEVIAESEAHGPTVLSQQPPDFIATVYERLLLIMAEAGQYPDAGSAANLRAQGVKQVWNEISQMLNLKEAISPPVDEVLINDLPTIRLNSLRFTTIQAQPSWQPNQSTMTSGVHGGLPRFSRTGAEDILLTIISRTVDVNVYMNPVLLEAQRQTGVKEVVKVLVGGGDGYMNYILQGFINLHYFGEKLPPAVLDQLDFRFYLLPTGNVNSLATYIGVNDIWYDANIKRMLTSGLPFVPHVASPKQIHEDLFGLKQKQQELDPDWQTITPRNLLTKQVENYVLEATNNFRISIFKCDAWYHDGQTETYCTIPFFARAEIGLTAALVSPMGERQLGQHAGAPRAARTATETIASMCQKVGFNFSITFTGLAFDDKELPHKKEEGRYTSFMVVNVPKPHEHSLACEPWSDHMDFFVLDSTHKAVADQKINSLSDLAYWSRPGRANWISVEAVKGEEEESPINFDIVIDGEVFGPFHRVTFSPCIHPMHRNQNLKLPLMTYWPPQISRFK